MASLLCNRNTVNCAMHLWGWLMSSVVLGHLGASLCCRPSPWPSPQQESSSRCLNHSLVLTGPELGEPLPGCQDRIIIKDNYRTFSLIQSLKLRQKRSTTTIKLMKPDWFTLIGKNLFVIKYSLLFKWSTLRFGRCRNLQYTFMEIQSYFTVLKRSIKVGKMAVKGRQWRPAKSQTMSNWSHITMSLRTAGCLLT